MTVQARPARRFPLRAGVAEVLRVEPLTPHMTRIVLAGQDLADFPVEQPGEIVTLLFPPPGRAPVLPIEGWRFPPEAEGQEWRNYTVRRHEPGRLDVDFVLHPGNAGPASSWAARAQRGDALGFAGPRPDWEPDPAADWQLLAGDETALPAIAAILETLPAGTRALAFVEIEDAAEEQPIDTAADVDLAWVHRDGEPAGVSRALERAIRAAELPGGRGRAWAAGESLAMRGVREHLRGERGLPRTAVKAKGYWKHRDTPEDVE